MYGRYSITDRLLGAAHVWYISSVKCMLYSSAQLALKQCSLLVVYEPHISLLLKQRCTSEVCTE